MNLEVDVEGDTIFLEGRSFLVPLSEQQAAELAALLIQAASQARACTRAPDGN